MKSKGVCMPILAFVLISVGGLMLHIRTHLPAKSAFYWIPIVFGVANVFVLPFLFNSPRTVALAFLLAVLTVIVGAVGMGYFSFKEFQKPEAVLTVKSVLLNSTLSDIIVLSAKIPIALAILRHFRPKTSDA